MRLAKKKNTFFQKENKSIFLFFLLSLFLFFARKASAGIVPCGLGANDPCTLCHFIIGFKNLVDWGLNLYILASLIILIAAGIIYIVSAGSVKLITISKNLLLAGLKGFVILILAWFIVNNVILVISAKTDLGVQATDWHTFTCDTAPN